MHLAKSMTIYLFSGVLNNAIPFVLLPILTRYLTPSEFGFLSIYQVMLAFTLTFVGMAMQINISRNFRKLDRDAMAKLIGNLLYVLSFSMGFVLFVFSVGAIFIGPIFGMPKGWIIALPLIAALSMVNQFNLTILRNQERPVVYGAFEVAYTTVNLMVSLVLIVGFGFGWEGRVAGIVCAVSCFGFGGFVYIRRQGLAVFNFSRKVTGEILRISLPLIPHTVGVVIITMSDRLFIERMVGMEAVGLYTVGYTFGMIVSLFVESFSKAWSPWFFQQLFSVTKGRKKRIVQYSYAYFGGILLLAIIVTGIGHVLLPFMVAPEYYSSTRYIGWIAAGYAFRGMYTIVFPYLVHEARTNFVGIMTSVAAVLNLGFNFVLIKANGPVGAAQATVIAFAVSFLGTWWYASRIYPMPWSRHTVTSE